MKLLFVRILVRLFPSRRDEILIKRVVNLHGIYF